LAAQTAVPSKRECRYLEFRKRKDGEQSRVLAALREIAEIAE